MGCDIHIVIQRQEANGRWHEVAYQTRGWQKNWTPQANIPIAPENFRSRNYDLFAILADVRNGFGFAGVPTGDGWPSLAPDRGLPAGFSEDNVLPDPNWPEEGPRS